MGKYDRSRFALIYCLLRWHAWHAWHGCRALSSFPIFWMSTEGRGSGGSDVFMCPGSGIQRGLWPTRPGCTVYEVPSTGIGTLVDVLKGPISFPPSLPSV